MADRLVLEPEPSSVGQARRFCAATLDRWGTSPDVAERVTLLLSELVTNVVLHAGTPCQVAISHDTTGAADGEDRVRVEVVDEDPTPPQAKHYEVDAGSGRGLQLIEAMSDRCGTEVAAAGKTVWFEVAGPV